MRATTSLLTLLLLAVAPSGAGGEQQRAGAPASDTTRLPGAAEPVRFVLDNGLRVWVQEDRRRPIVHVRTLYKVGSLNEGPGTTGLAHYVEHMVYRAGETIANEDITGIIDRIGGRWTGGTGPAATSYGETVPEWALDDALRITAERMTRTLFDDVEFERERHNVVTEASGFARSDPLSAFRDALLATSFEVHPYRHTSNTWARDNLTVTRAEAYDFYRQYYGPNNAVLAIVGDVRVADVRRLVEHHFGALPRAPRSGRVDLVEPPQRAEKRVTLTHPDVQPRVELLFRAPQAQHADYPVLVVLDRVLAARFAAIHGAAISTSHDARPYPFIYRIVAEPDAADAADAAGLERVAERIQTELDAVARAGVTAAELRAARTPAAAAVDGAARDGAAPSPSVPTAAGLARLATELTSREVFPWEVSPELRAAIGRAQQDVTPADVQAYARRWLRRSQRTVGVLVPGDDDFVPDWSDDRPLAGQRMEIPPLTVPPARRLQPLPVPEQALQPLAALPLATARAELANGAVLRAVGVPHERAALHAGGAAQGDSGADVSNGDAALQLRLGVSAAADSPAAAARALLAARLLGDAAGGVTAGAVVETGTALDLVNDGWFDIRLRIPSADIATTLAGIAQLLRAPSVSAAQLDRVRATLIEQLDSAAADQAGASIARRLVVRGAVPAWHVAPAADAEALATVTAAEVQRFLAENATAAALHVAIAAPHDPAWLIEQATVAFAALPARRSPPAAAAHRESTAAGEAAAPAPGATAGAAAEHRIDAPGATQVDIAAALPGVPRGHPDWWALQLLNYIVGMPFYGGRLGWALTKSGLTYSSAATTVSGADAGYILITTRSDTNNLEATLQAIREVVAQIGEDGVDEWELREAQGFTLGRMLLNGPRDDSDAAVLAAALLDSESARREWLDLPAVSREILAVTHADVQRVARRYYRAEWLHVAAVGALPAERRPSPFAPGTFRALFDATPPAADAHTFHVELDGRPNGTPFIPHGNPNVRGDATITFHRDTNTLTWDIRPVGNEFAVTQAHFYNVNPESSFYEPTGASIFCWGGRWSDHDFLVGSGFPVARPHIDDILRNPADWMLIMHTEGGHFANDGAGLVVFDPAVHRINEIGVDENRHERWFSNRIGKRLGDRTLREANPHFTADNDFLEARFGAGYFDRQHYRPFPDALGNVWLEPDGAGGWRLTAAARAAGYDLETEYLYYRYADDGPSWDWGGSEGAFGGVLQVVPAATPADAPAPGPSGCG